MADVELRLTADAGGAEKSIAGLRKEYQELIKAVQKPIGQIDALQKTQETAKKASTDFYAAKRRVDELKTALAAAGQPVKALDRDLAAAERTLNRATRAFDLQKTRVREQRAELKAAGIDTRNLAAEQQRLQAAMANAVGRGQADTTITRAMDTFGVTRLRELRAQLVTLRSDYARLTQAGKMSAQERIGAEIQYQASLRRTQQQIAEITSAEANGGGAAAIGARIAAIVAAAYAVQRAAGFFFSSADAVGELEDRMRGALPVQQEYIAAQARLEDISKRVRIPIAQTSQLFLGSIKPLQEMGFSVSQTTDLVGALSAGLVANSVKGQQAAAVIDQFTKGLQTGTIRGDAFNAILQNSTALTDALMKGLGVTRQELIRMANAGELSSEKVITAFAGQADALLGLADAMRTTVGDAQGTLADSIDRIIASIDNFLGVSDLAVTQLDRLSGALDRASASKAPKWLDRFTEVFKLLGNMDVQNSAFSFLLFGFPDADSGLSDIVDDQQVAADKLKAIEDRRLSDARSFATRYNDSIQNNLVRPFKIALDDQVAAQNKANSKLRKAQEEQIATQKRYKDAMEKLRIGATGPASFSNAQTLRVAANQALASGDFTRAKKYAQESLEMLMKLAEEGGNTYGFSGLIKGLQAIETQADKSLVAAADTERKAQIEKVRVMKKEFEELKNFKITPTIDDEALAKADAKLKNWAAMIGESFKIQPRIGESKAPEGWHAPLALPKSGTAPSSAAAAKASTPVAADVRPVGIKQDAASADTLPPVSAPIKPAGIRQDGPNSWTNLPAVEAEILPKGIRKVSDNSFTNLPAVEVDILPKGIRKDGPNSFTNLPIDGDVVVKKVTPPEGEQLVVPALLKPLPMGSDAPAVEVKSSIDEQSKAVVAEQFGAFIQELANSAVITLRLQTPNVAAGPVQQLPGLATGGKVRGPGTGTSDSVLMWGSNGEFMQPTAAVDYYGLAFMEKIRRRELPRHATGGLIGMEPPRSLPAAPQPSQALLDRAAGPDFHDYGTLLIDMGGGTTQTVYIDRGGALDLGRVARKFGGTKRN